MKKVIKLSAIILIAFLFSCASQKITSSWVNQDTQAKGPYKSVCVIALVPDNTTKFAIEEKMAQLLEVKGVKAVKSTSIFPPKIANEVISREELIGKLKSEGCDAVLTLAELDVKTEEKYVPGVQTMPLPPLRYRYYGSYYSYYDYRFNQVYQPGYITKETTYFFETNFYDVATEDLLWSIQSNAFEPSNINSWFDEYSSLIIKELKKQNIVK